MSSTPERKRGARKRERKGKKGRKRGEGGRREGGEEKGEGYRHVSHDPYPQYEGSDHLAH